MQATPASGRPEKVRRHAFYLLRDNLAAIEEAARRETPPPSLAEFADSLELSDELKAWVKRTQITDFRGDAFRRALTSDDVMEIEEFRVAYIETNLPMMGLGFPRPKLKLSDRTKNPEKWDKKEKEYYDKVRAYLEIHPESIKDLDEHTLEFNPGSDWRGRVQQNERRVRQAVMRLIQGRYLVARDETDLNGTAQFSVPPGRYYLTNLWNEARAGDVSLRWELPIDLPAAKTYYLTLNNANSLPQD